MRVRPPDERSRARGRRIMADVRRCIGSARFAIEPHDAPVADFPSQPSAKDGLGRMCKVHWNAYTAGLARDAKARKAVAPASEAPTAAGDAAAATDPDPAPAKPARTRRKVGRADEAGVAAPGEGDPG